MVNESSELQEQDNPAEEIEIVTDPADDHETASEPETQARNIDYTSRKSLMLVLVLVTVLAFLNSLNGRFTYDDVHQIAENNTLGHWDGKTVKSLFTHDVWATFKPDFGGGKLESIYYRPVFTLFLMAGYTVAGNHPDNSPLKWHLITLLLHLISVLLCLLVLEKSIVNATDIGEKKARMLAAFGAAVFAVHPVQSESVAWISGLVNPLSAITMFATFYYYMEYREKRRIAALVTGIILFAISALTKESSLALVAIIAACELFIFNRDSAWSAKFKYAVTRTLPFACVMIAYLALRYSVLGILAGTPKNGNFPDDQSLTIMDNLLTLPAVLVAYMKLVLVPFNLSLLYDFGYTRSIGFGNFWLPLAVVLIVASGFAWAWKRVPGASIAIVWITIPILPHLNTRAFFSEELFHDRYLYISIAGVGLLVGLVLNYMAERNLLRLQEPDLAKVAALVLTVLCFLTVVQNRHWQSSAAMWQQAAKSAPNTREVQLALGWMAEMKGEAQTALQHYDAALRIQPDMIDALNNSALVLGRTRQWEEATRRFERIVELTPERAIAHYNLAFAYAAQKRFAEAMREQSMAISLDPNGPRSNEWRTMLARLEKLSADQSAPPVNKN
jgi:tetratricopeptide (TPR) repeat protein